MRPETVEPEHSSGVRVLQHDEIDGVCGGFLDWILGYGAMVGFIAGAIAANVNAGQPWYSNDFKY
jgi:hypothetical protein